MPHSLKKRLVLGSLALGYGKLVTAGVQLLMIPVLVHGWGLAVYGQWLVISAIPVFLGASDLGFGIAAGNRLIGEIARDERDEARNTFQSAFVTVQALAFTVLAVALATCLLLPSWVFEVRDGIDAGTMRTTAVILMLYGVAALNWALFGAIAKAMGNFHLSAAIEATSKLAEGGAVIGIVALGGTPLEAAIGFLAMRLLGIASHVALAFHLVSWLRPGIAWLSSQRIQELLRPAIAAMVLPLSQAAFLQGTVMVVGAAGGAAMVPIYSSVRTVSRVGFQLAVTLSAPLMPEYAVAHGTGNETRKAGIAGALAIANMIIGPACAIGLALFGSWLFDLWTGGAIQPPPTMLVYTAIGLGLTIVWQPLSDLLLSINRHEGYSYTYLACALGTIPLSYAMVRTHGVTGAAMANLVLEVTMLFTVLYSLRRNGCRFELRPSVLKASLPERMRKLLP